MQLYIYIYIYVQGQVIKTVLLLAALTFTIWTENNRM